MTRMQIFTVLKELVADYRDNDKDECLIYKYKQQILQ